MPVEPDARRPRSLSLLGVPLRSRRVGALVVVSLVELMVLMDTTVINIALPHAQSALHISVGNRQWVVTAYALAFGSLLLLGGRLSDLWGRRRALYGGLVGFALASALGGAAQSFSTLVVARALQGAFAALLAPAALAALSLTFSHARARARAFVIYSAVGASGAAMGLVLGGALTQWATWRWCLFINVVLALVALVGVALFVPGGRGDYRTRLDATSTVLASAGLFGLVFGLSHAVSSSWTSVVTLASLVVGAGLLVVFVSYQQRSTHPLLPLRILTDRTRGGSLVALLLTSVSLYAASLLLAYYLEQTLGYSPLRAGIAFTPLVVGVALSATYASARLLEKTGPRPLVPAGMLLAMMGMILFTRLTTHADYWGHVLPGLLLTGLGLGLVFAPSLASATARLEERDVGAASALVNTAQMIGVSIGTALLNTIAVTVTLRAMARARDPLARAQHQATLHGYSVTFWWSAGVFALGALVTLFLLESAPVTHEDAPLAGPALDVS